MGRKKVFPKEARKGCGAGLGAGLGAAGSWRLTKALDDGYRASGCALALLGVCLSRTQEQRPER